MNRVRLIVVCFAVVAVAMRYGCSHTKSPDKVIHVRPDDPRMNAAIEKARASVGTFIAALQSPKPGQVGFGVKAKFTDGRHDEHIWLDDVTYDGVNFQGTIGNEPEMVNNVKNGQTATVAPAEISDWMYIENRKLVGGETIRVLRDSVSPSERAELDKSVNFIVE
ncbi:MAG TPA: DUF2314 domain-containing protein [Planctomycetaceae bacterium]|jgi:uncharacterized protein YegJ (DUF2314 family)|nr:DUF2314 domain-containing protein [Planctomycetaceae bacterium]